MKFPKLLFTVRCRDFQHYFPDEYLLGSKGSFNPDIPIDEQPECIAYQDKWEFPREKLEFGKQMDVAL